MTKPHHDEVSTRLSAQALSSPQGAVLDGWHVEKDSPNKHPSLMPAVGQTGASGFSSERQ